MRQTECLTRGAVPVERLGRDPSGDGEMARRRPQVLADGHDPDAGLATKSGLIVGMGETDDEVFAALADLRGVGVGVVTIGQYLRPTARHLPVARWVPPPTFEEYRRAGARLGFAHVEASPLTRSSYHARDAAAAASATLTSTLA